MKMMKKLLSIIMAVLLLAAAGAAAVSAEEPAQPDMEALQQSFAKYLDEKGWPGTEKDISFMLYSNQWAVFSQDFGEPLLHYERIGNHIFWSLNYHYPYELGAYAEKDGKILTLKEAYDTGVINIDEIAQWCYQRQGETYPAAIHPGDTDENGVVELTDVLDVQKYIAKLWNADDSYYALLCDFDGDGETSMKDVLGMQKLIAKAAD